MFAAKISSSGECSWWWGVRLRPVVNEVYVGEAIEPVARSNSGLFYKVGSIVHVRRKTRYFTRRDDYPRSL